MKNKLTVIAVFFFLFFGLIVAVSGKTSSDSSEVTRSYRVCLNDAAEKKASCYSIVRLNYAGCVALAHETTNDTVLSAVSKRASLRESIRQCRGYLETGLKQCLADYNMKKLQCKEKKFNSAEALKVLH